MQSITLEKVGPENLAACGIGCLADPRHPGFRAKTAWLRRRFREGLRYLVCRNRRGRSLGFLEYVPGEYAWRPVDAAGWLFVHCLWVFARGQKGGGLGSRLVQACLAEARAGRARGVAAMVSDGPWMAGPGVFLKNGFGHVSAADRFQLLACRLRRGPAPRFKKPSLPRTRSRGLHIVYAPQCPLLIKSVEDLAEMAAEYGLAAKVTELTSARAAQRAPSYYGVFSLIWNGRLLSDHYVSRGRFANLLEREILPELSS
jgi:L-amino acid N-acyltransferase YncA